MFRPAELPLRHALHRSQGEPGGQNRRQAEQKHAGPVIEGSCASDCVNRRRSRHARRRGKACR